MENQKKQQNDDSIEQKKKDKDPNRDVEPQRDPGNKPQER